MGDTKTARNVRDLVVVGAGPAGLCGAWFGRKRGWAPLIIDAGTQVGGAWRGMDPEMECLSPRHRDRMPDGRYPVGDGAIATAAQVVRMLESFQEDVEFEIQFEQRVERVELHKHGFRLFCGEHTLHTRRLVAATGEFGRPVWPAVDGLKANPSFHAGSFDRSVVKAGETVVVIGAGNSGAEVAVGLARRGAVVTVSSRAPITRPRALPSVLSPVGWHLSGIPLRLQPHRGGCTDRVPLERTALWDAIQQGDIQQADATAALLSDGIRTESGRVVKAAHVIFCTGYRRDNGWLGDLIQRDDAGFPLHQDGIIPKVPGLGVLGVPCLRTWRSGFLRGFSDDAQSVIGRLV